MAAVRLNKSTGKLFIDFRYAGKRYREYTMLTDTTQNKRKLERLGAKLEMEISLGKFDYVKFFPNSPVVKRLAADINEEKVSELPYVASSTQRIQASNNVELTPVDSTPLFKDFVEVWVMENKISWRNSHLTNMLNIIKCHYLSAFGNKKVGSIARADLLKFRSDLSKVPGRNGNSSLSANRINKIMDPLRRIFEEAADRFEFNTPFIRIKPLKIQKSDVQPFSLHEVFSIVNNVRPDYKNYYVIRFFSGMRTGEIDGLKWKYVDFDRRQILVRETLVAGKEDYTKTDSSQREICMSEPVFKALQKQYEATGHMSRFVFCNLKGGTVDHNNITKRVWYPLLAKLRLTKRRPYQTRHTAATLWLAAGETPEWIARQMGHANTEMLFKVYSRYVPNLTRKDGSAFERLLGKEMNPVEK